MSTRFVLTDDEIKEYDNTLTLEQVVIILNEYEEYRKKKNKRISELNEVIELQREVICGVRAYLRLKEIWY